MVAVPAAALGVRESRPSAPQQDLDIVSVARPQRDSDARRDEQLPVGQADRLGQLGEQSAGNDRRLVSQLRADQEHRELGRTDPGQPVAGAHAALEPLRDGLDDLISDGTTEGVVDLLEPIDQAAAAA